MSNSGIESQELDAAILRSERTRIKTLIGVYGSLMVLVLVRGAMARSEGHRGEAWPYALLLALMAGYEVVWLRFIERAIESKRVVSIGMWRASIFVESLLPTAILFMQLHTPSFGPSRALTSPAVLAYFLLILLSTLHLNPRLSVLAGVLSAAG